MQLGDEVTLVWGEPDGGTKKITVERHKQTQHPRDRQRRALLQVRPRDLRGRLAHGQEITRQAGLQRDRSRRSVGQHAPRLPQSGSDQLATDWTREKRGDVSMTHKNLQEAIKAAKNPVNMLRNSQIGPYAFPGRAAANSRTGATSSARGERPARCSISRIT